MGVGSGVSLRTALGCLLSFAERAVVPAEALIPIPEGLAQRDAVARLHDGRTALQLLEAAGVRSGEWVLITAAAGGAGVLLVQVLHALGARVIGAARGARKLAVVRELGAKAVVDYSERGWTDRVRDTTGGRGVDVVLDGAGWPDRCAGVRDDCVRRKVRHLRFVQRWVRRDRSPAGSGPSGAYHRLVRSSIPRLGGADEPDRAGAG